MDPKHMTSLLLKGEKKDSVEKDSLETFFIQPKRKAAISYGALLGIDGQLRQDFLHTWQIWK